MEIQQSLTCLPYEREMMVWLSSGSLFAGHVYREAVSDISSGETSVDTSSTSPLTLEKDKDVIPTQQSPPMAITEQKVPDSPKKAVICSRRT